MNHFIHPLSFLGKQIGILIPFLILCLFLISKYKVKINLRDRKLIFLLVINIFPILFIFLTSLLMGIKIRTMWMTPFYLFFGVLFIYIFQNKINLKKIKYFFLLFLFLFLFSPSAYFYVSVTQKDKRTDYPGKIIAQTVQEKWNVNFKNKIGIVGGDEWHGGNLVYHIKPRPKWDNIFKNNKNNLTPNTKDGFVLIGDSNILSKICNGIFIKIKNQGVCMIGERK